MSRPSSRVHGPKWSSEETMMAFALYMMLPQKDRDDINDPAVKNLAAFIHRTPGSVALKFSNIGAHDPNRIARGLAGMSHGSKLDAQIWEEYAADGEIFLGKCLNLLPPGLLTESMNLVEPGPQTSLERSIDDLLKTIPLGKEREALVVQRVNQSYFPEFVAQELWWEMLPDRPFRSQLIDSQPYKTLGCMRQCRKNRCLKRIIIKRFT